MKDFKKRPSVKSILQMDIVQTKAQLLKIPLPLKRQEKQDMKTNEDARPSLGATNQTSLNKSLSQDKTPRVSEKAAAAQKKKPSINAERPKESPNKKVSIARSRNSSFFSSSNSQSSRENACMPCMRD